MKLCFVDTDSFIMNVKKTLLMMLKKDMIHQIICVKDHYQWVKIKKVIGLMKDELGGKIMKEFIELRPNCYSYSMNDGKVDKRAKGIKKCVTKIYYIS